MKQLADIAVMASGKGSNLQVLLAAAQAERCPFRVKVVIADRADAGALGIARDARVATVVFIDPKAYADRAAYDAACADVVWEAGCDWVVLAGYMRLLSSSFVQRFSGRIVNIHPALLPAFPGAHGVEDALQHGVKITGCTVHLVDDQLDNGPILAQAMVDVHDDDDVESLRTRIQQQEHHLYPKVLARLVTQGFDLDGRRVLWRGGER